MRVPVYNIQKIRKLVLYGAMIAAAGIARMESMTEAERKALIEKISFGVRPRWPLEMLPKAALPERLTV